MRLSHLGIQGLSARRRCHRDISGGQHRPTHLLSYLVLSGSTQFEDVADHVYQPTRILQSVAELTEEVRTGMPDRASGETILPVNGFRSAKAGLRHQTDIFALYKPRPHPAMTK